MQGSAGALRGGEFARRGDEHEHERNSTRIRSAPRAGSARPTAYARPVGVAGEVLVKLGRNLAQLGQAASGGGRTGGKGEVWTRGRSSDAMLTAAHGSRIGPIKFLPLFRLPHLLQGMLGKSWCSTW